MDDYLALSQMLRTYNKFPYILGDMFFFNLYYIKCVCGGHLALSWLMPDNCIVYDYLKFQFLSSFHEKKNKQLRISVPAFFSLYLNCVIRFLCHPLRLAVNFRCWHFRFSSIHSIYTHTHRELKSLRMQEEK